FSQQTQFVDFKSVHGQIKLNPIEKSVSGIVSYKFEILKPIDTIRIDAINMEFSKVKLNNKPIKIDTNGKQLLLIYPFKKGKHTLNFSYNTIPKQTLYFIGSDKNDDLQIWTQGQGKYTSHWFPSFDDVNEKMVFNMTVTFDNKYQVQSNGVVVNKKNISTLTQWNFQMGKPMSSYLLVLAVGKFNKQVVYSNSGIPIEMYYEPKDKAKVEPTYRYSKQIFDFLEEEIGVKYPWKIYKQIPIRDFLYAGMENTSTTLYANQFVTDSIGFEDQNYVNVNAHEQAHQWFGDLVTAESGTHHWLQEGFATYYALLAEKKVFGDDYFYNKLYDYSLQIKKASKTDTIPILSPNASSLTYYQKGALALHVLKEAVGGDIFKKSVKDYLEKHSFQNVNTDEFLQEIKKNSNYDIEIFSKIWLEDKEYNDNIINELISKNKSIKLLFEINVLKNKPLSEKRDFFIATLQSDVYWTVKRAIIYQLRNENFDDKKQFFQLALQSNNNKVRQVVASVLTEVPEDFRVNYESLLDDKSYQTREIVLSVLWKNFPEHRIRYLDKSKDWFGFNDYNLRIVWLSLTLSTPDYTCDKEALIKELIDYSSNKFEAIVRQNAIGSLIALGIANDAFLINLVNMTTHHAWNYSKFGKNSIVELLKNSNIRIEFETILPNLNQKEQFQLERLLKTINQ
ncbi:M1 family metallopeptidase, partial [Flavobacterium sp.]|uniref:M1 family metallopeptidase n=1 Tax=Flavobacterium sp. TaxID=239 RepID=UPI0038FC9109